MAKLYYPNGDELQGAKPLNEQLWFPRHQPQLLRLANTKEGRDLLCLDSFPELPIVALRKNEARYWTGEEFISDFRIGAKWGNVIRYRWGEYQKAVARINFLEMKKAWPAIYDSKGRLLQPIGGGDTLTAYPEPDTESTTVDGTAQQSNDNDNWTNIQGGSGNGFIDNSALDRFVMIQEYGTSKWAFISRCFFLYDTASLTSDATISATVLSVKEATQGGSPRNDFTSNAFTLNIFSSAPADNVSIEAGDYNSLGTTNFATDLGWEISSDVYADFTFLEAGRDAVSKTSISKFGGREADFDAPNTEPAFQASSSELEVNIHFADVAGTNEDPKLVVTFTLPAVFTPKVIMF
jgi:hypothetical protein